MRMPGPAALAVLSVLLLAACGAQQAPAGQGAAPGEVQSRADPAPAAAAANGIEKLSAPEALSRAQKAFVGASSVRVVLTARTEKLTADVQLQGKDHARVTMTQGSKTVKVILVGSAVYLLTKELGDLWVKTSVSDKEFVKFEPLIKRDQLFKEFAAAASKPGMKSGPGGKVNGHDSIKLTGGTVSIYLATDGAPYPLRVVDTDSTGGATVDFTGYGSRAAITAPPASKVISS